ncbi:MAG: ATP-binding protein [Deferrisomatales bacterium]|nr:ATP-binding protein [Deferrisomatales bacterium]
MKEERALLASLLTRLDRIARGIEGSLGEGRQRATVPDPPALDGRAFVWDGPRGFRAVRRPAPVGPDVLTGIDRQRTSFYANALRFARGLPAHDVLLWGDRGTGKSSLVCSLTAALPREPLALLEVPEQRARDLPRVLDALGSDSRRWVLYLDDLSFGRLGSRYRELKVLLEGGLEGRPPNTLVVATSNRRHLVPEAFPPDGEIHPEESVAETVSLADRFGLSLGFYPFDEPTYLEAVRRHLACLMTPAPAGWEAEALRWAMARGIRSGRTALHAAREIAGRTALRPGGFALPFPEKTV